MISSIVSYCLVVYLSISKVQSVIINSRQQIYFSSIRTTAVKIPKSPAVICAAPEQSELLDMLEQTHVDPRMQMVTVDVTVETVPIESEPVNTSVYLPLVPEVADRAFAAETMPVVAAAEKSELVFPARK